MHNQSHRRHRAPSTSYIYARPSTPTHNSIIIDDIITLITNKSRQPSTGPHAHLLWSLLAKPMPQQYHYTPTKYRSHLEEREIGSTTLSGQTNPYCNQFTLVHFFRARYHCCHWKIIELLPLGTVVLVDRIISVVLQCLGLCTGMICLAGWLFDWFTDKIVEGVIWVVCVFSERVNTLAIYIISLTVRSVILAQLMFVQNMCAWRI